MGKWSETHSNVYDEHGNLVALCEAGDRANQIAREHNALDMLVELLRSLRDAPYGLSLLPYLSEHACEGTIRDTWIPQIDAALALAEGRE